MKMLKALCGAGLLLCTGTLQAQSDSLFNKKFIGDICTELTKNRNAITPENLEQQLAKILAPKLARYANEIKTFWNYDVTDDAQGEEVGRKAGLLLVAECPAFVDLIVQAEGVQGSGNKQLTGTLARIATQQFTYLVVKSKNGKEDKIWWLEYFEGSDKLQRESATFLNKNITVSYKEVEWYEAVNKEYKTIKVITAIN